MTIEIGPRGQFIALLALLGAVAAAVASQGHEIERYLKAKEM